MKFLGKLLGVILFSCLLELFVFNFNSTVLLFDNSYNRNITFDMERIQTINWSEKNGKLTSEKDPMLIINNINEKIRSVEVQLKTSKKIPFIMMYYTNNENPTFNDNYCAYTDDVQERNLIFVGEPVKSLRIDLGDSSGMILRDIKIIANPFRIDFSVSRVIAILLIYLSTVFLFSLQKNPDYLLDTKDKA